MKNLVPFPERHELTDSAYDEICGVFNQPPLVPQPSPTTHLRRAVLTLIGNVLLFLLIGLACAGLIRWLE